MKYFAVGFSLILFGIALLVVFSLLGLASVGLFIIFPFFFSTNPISAIPIIIIIFGFLILFFAPFSGSIERNEDRSEPNLRGESKKSFGGIIMIGPVPIIFGSSRKMVYALIGVAVVIIILIFVFYYL